MNSCITSGHVNCWFTDGKLVLALCANCMTYKNDAPDAMHFPDLSKVVRLDLHPNPPIGNPAFPTFGLPPDLTIQKIKQWQEASGCATPEDLAQAIALIVKQSRETEEILRGVQKTIREGAGNV